MQFINLLASIILAMYTLRSDVSALPLAGGSEPTAEEVYYSIDDLLLYLSSGGYLGDSSEYSLKAARSTLDHIPGRPTIPGPKGVFTPSTNEVRPEADRSSGPSLDSDRWPFDGAEVYTRGYGPPPGTYAIQVKQPRSLHGSSTDAASDATRLLLAGLRGYADLASRANREHPEGHDSEKSLKALRAVFGQVPGVSTAGPKIVIATPPTIKVKPDTREGDNEKVDTDSDSDTARLLRAGLSGHANLALRANHEHDGEKSGARCR